MAATVDLRHPDSPLTLTVSPSAVRVYRARGWVPADEFKAPKPKRQRRPPAPVANIDPPTEFTDPWFAAKARDAEDDLSRIEPTPDLTEP